LQDPKQITRRVFLGQAAGLTLTLGTGSLLYPLLAQTKRNPYAQGLWVAGDHHIHTKFSPDGLYEIVHQVAMARRFGLHWCVITDHGGPHHDKVALEQAYPDIVAARRAYPDLIVFQGLEWNVPSAEHGSVILPPTPHEASIIAEFEALFDSRNVSRENTPASTEADAIAGIKYLQSLQPKPLYVANHPSRKGLSSPHEMRAWADAGPTVTRGFEGAPGHQAGTLTGSPRGAYGGKPNPDSWPGYPLESYQSYGGYDWSVAHVGGLWDSLLGEGRPWYITANSDSHRHYTDRTVVDTSTYLTKGYVTPTDKRHERYVNDDFYPGEYEKTWVHVLRKDPMAILDAMRMGNMFTVLGDLIDRLEFYAHSADKIAPMGSTLYLHRPGEDVEVVLRLRVPKRENFGKRRPMLHHVDWIAGNILGPAKDRSSITNPTTKVVAQMPVRKAEREGEFFVFRYRFPKVRQSFYVRVRGTNTSVEAPQADSLTVDPWEDLWFYGNPIFIRVPPR
jgi:hypothetical protein